LAAIFDLYAGVAPNFNYANSLVEWDVPVITHSQMTNWIRRSFTTVLMLFLSGAAYSDSLTYQQDFTAEVIEFANLNRLNIARLNRDVHAHCYIPVSISTIILSDGSVKDVSIVKSSTVPVVDRYFLYIIEQASPYQPLANHYDPAPEEITINWEFKLDVKFWGYGIRSTRPCEELELRDSKTD
jgi:TonB family protein